MFRPPGSVRVCFFLVRVFISGFQFFFISSSAFCLYVLQWIWVLSQCFTHCLVAHIASPRMGAKTQAWRLVASLCSQNVMFGCLITYAHMANLTFCTHDELMSHHHTWNNFMKWWPHNRRAWTHSHDKHTWTCYSTNTTRRYRSIHTCPSKQKNLNHKNCAKRRDEATRQTQF